MSTNTPTDEEVAYPIPGPHDRRCEAVVPGLQGRSMMGCRCGRRNEVRTLAVEMGTAGSVSDETLRMAGLPPFETMRYTIDRLMSATLRQLDEHRRELIPSSMMVTTEHDRIIDGVTIRVEVLALPFGSLQDDAVLEVAADWVTQKYRLRS